MFSFATYLARLAAIGVFLKSNAFELLGLEVEKIYRMSAAKVKGLGIFLVLILAFPIVLIVMACLSGWFLGEYLGYQWAAMLAAGVIKVAALLCGASLLMVWLRPTVYAHLLVLGAQIGAGLISAFTSLAGKVLSAGLKVSAESPLEHSEAMRFSAWLRRTVFWAEVVCVLVAVLPIWRGPSLTMVIALGIIALAMGMSRIQSEWPYRVAMVGLLGIVVFNAFALLSPVLADRVSRGTSVLADRGSRWVATTIGIEEGEEEAILQKKLDELRAEDLAIMQRGLKAEKTFASAEDEARHAAITVLIPEYEARLHHRPPPVRKPDTPPAVTAASEPVPQEVATTSLPPEEPPPAIGIAALGPPEPEPVNVITEQPAKTTSSPAVGKTFDREKAKAVLRKYGRL